MLEPTTLSSAAIPLASTSPTDMNRILLSLVALVALATTAQAQVPCVGVGGVNTVPQVGISCQQEFSIPTYHATGVAIAIGTAPTDVACITGSATKVIRLKKVRLSGTAGTAININTFLTKHTIANTGGTPATGTALPTASPNDSTFAAASATLQAYTANPTVDASAIVVNGATLFLPVTTTAGNSTGVIFDWSTGGIAISPPVLRGIAQQYCVNFNGVTAPSSGVLNVEWVWTEAAL